MTAGAVDEYLDKHAHHVRKKYNEFPAQFQRRKAVDTNAKYDRTEGVLK